MRGRHCTFSSFPHQAEKKNLENINICQRTSRECYLSEITGDMNKYLAERQVPQSPRVRSIKTRKEEPPARRGLGERDLPGRRNTMCKGLKARKPGFSEEAEERMQARGWWERDLERQTEASPG